MLYKGKIETSPKHIYNIYVMLWGGLNLTEKLCHTLHHIALWLICLSLPRPKPPLSNWSKEGRCLLFSGNFTHLEERVSFWGMEM